LNLKCPYQANVMKMFDASRSSTGTILGDKSSVMRESRLEEGGSVISGQGPLLSITLKAPPHIGA
jgi:hypothetical protein